MVVIPIALLTAASWINYVAAFRNAHDRVVNTTDSIHECSLKVFEIEVGRSEEFHRYLQQFSSRPQILLLFKVGARLVKSGLMFGLPGMGTERHFAYRKPEAWVGRD